MKESSRVPLNVLREPFSWVQMTSRSFGWWLQWLMCWIRKSAFDAFEGSCRFFFEARDFEGPARAQRDKSFDTQTSQHPANLFVWLPRVSTWSLFFFSFPPPPSSSSFFKNTLRLSPLTVSSSSGGDKRKRAHFEHRLRQLSHHEKIKRNSSRLKIPAAFFFLYHLGHFWKLIHYLVTKESSFRESVCSLESFN